MFYMYNLNTSIDVIIFLEAVEMRSSSAQGSSSNTSTMGIRVICEKCSCTYPYGEACLRCVQDAQYQQSLIADKDPKPPAEEKCEDSVLKGGQSNSSEVGDLPNEGDNDNDNMIFIWIYTKCTSRLL